MKSKFLHFLISFVLIFSGLFSQSARDFRFYQKSTESSISTAKIISCENHFVLPQKANHILTQKENSHNFNVRFLTFFESKIVKADVLESTFIQKYKQTKKHIFHNKYLERLFSLLSIH